MQFTAHSPTFKYICNTESLSCIPAAITGSSGFQILESETLLIEVLHVTRIIAQSLSNGAHIQDVLYTNPT